MGGRDFVSYVTEPHSNRPAVVSHSSASEKRRFVRCLAVRTCFIPAEPLHAIVECLFWGKSQGNPPPAQARRRVHAKLTFNSIQYWTCEVIINKLDTGDH